jgi:regulator of sirC expression with transglutaminase-like and TPR domain
MVPPESPRARFAAQVGRPDAEIDLIEAALLIAAEHDTDLDLAACRAELDALVRRARAALVTPQPDAGQLCWFIAEAEGFRGNARDYYNPDNSYLDRVLATRSGIPISLALIYLRVAEALGLDAAGVGFPGHFLVRIAPSGGADAALIDPFTGRTLSRDDCRALLQTGTRGAVEFAEHMLQPTPKREILQRMLRNLKMIYLQREDFGESLSLCDRLLLIDADSLQEVMDRALILEKLQCFGPAADELERLAARTELAARPEAAASLRRKIEQLRGRGGSRTVH